MVLRIVAGIMSCFVIVGASLSAQAAASVEYSDIDLDTCPEGEDFGEAPAYEAICPGPDGWELRVMEGDLRFWVEPRRAGTQTPTNFQTLSPFNTVHTKAEWRGETHDGVFKPYAMVLRYFTGGNMGNPATRGNVLVVTKVPQAAGERACHVAYVDARAVSNANEIAAQMADALARDFDCDKHTAVSVRPGEPASQQQ